MKLLLFFLGRLRALASAALALGVRYPWPCACALLLALAWWQWSGKEDALGQRDKARAALAAEQKGRKADRADWQRQVATAKAVTAAAQRKSQEIASDAQYTHDALAADNAGLRDYIAAHRLSVASSAGAAAPATTAGDHAADVLASTAAGALVATSETDLAKCDADYVYALSAYAHGQKLIAGGLAK